MSLPYYDGSIVRVIEPEVEESVIAAHVEMVLPPLSSMTKVRAPQRSVNGAAAVSTASAGITNSDVAVEPSVTAIELEEKAVVLTVVVGRGLVTVRHGLVTVRV